MQIEIEPHELSPFISGATRVVDNKTGPIRLEISLREEGTLVLQFDDYHALDGFTNRLVNAVRNRKS
jgi:hypothetical protein